MKLYPHSFQSTEKSELRQQVTNGCRDVIRWNFVSRVDKMCIQLYAVGFIVMQADIIRERERDSPESSHDTTTHTDTNTNDDGLILLLLRFFLSTLEPLNEGLRLLEEDTLALRRMSVLIPLQHCILSKYVSFVEEDNDA